MSDVTENLEEKLLRARDKRLELQQNVERAKKKRQEVVEGIETEIAELEEKLRRAEKKSRKAERKLERAKMNRKEQDENEIRELELKLDETTKRCRELEAERDELKEKQPESPREVEDRIRDLERKLFMTDEKCRKLELQVMANRVKVLEAKLRHREKHHSKKNIDDKKNDQTGDQIHLTKIQELENQMKTFQEQNRKLEERLVKAETEKQNVTETKVDEERNKTLREEIKQREQIIRDVLEYMQAMDERSRKLTSDIEGALRLVATTEPSIEHSDIFDSDESVVGCHHHHHQQHQSPAHQQHVTRMRNLSVSDNDQQYRQSPAQHQHQTYYPDGFNDDDVSIVATRHPRADRRYQGKSAWETVAKDDGNRTSSKGRRAAVRGRKVSSANETSMHGQRKRNTRR
jgi:myosin heavy subunit